MLIGRVVISPDSRLTYTIEYPWLGDEETIVAVNNIEIVPNDGIFTVDTVVIGSESKTVSFAAGCGGDDTVLGNEYDVKMIVNTSASQISDDCLLFIIDGDC